MLLTSERINHKLHIYHILYGVNHVTVTFLRVR